MVKDWERQGQVLRHFGPLGLWELGRVLPRNVDAAPVSPADSDAPRCEGKDPALLIN